MDKRSSTEFVQHNTESTEKTEQFFQIQNETTTKQQKRMITINETFDMFVYRMVKSLIRLDK